MTAYQDLYCEALVNRLERKTKDGGLSPELERQQWEAILAVLCAYSSKENLGPYYTGHSVQAHPHEPFPAEVAIFLATVVEDLLTGRIPETLKATTKKHAPNYGPDVKGAIATAVLYANLANQNLINESKPVKRIQEMFGIKLQTWKDWRKQTPSDDADPRRFHVRLHGNTQKLTALALKALKRAANIYQGKGRPDTPVKE